MEDDLDTQTLVFFGDLVKFFGGPAALLVVFSYLLLTGKWVVTRREYDKLNLQCEKLNTEKDEWKELALKSTNVAVRSTQTAEKAVEKGVA